MHATAGELSRCIPQQHAKPGTNVSHEITRSSYKGLFASIFSHHTQACLWTPAELSGWLDKKGRKPSWQHHTAVPAFGINFA